jgi:hypothetical protein
MRPTNILAFIPVDGWAIQPQRGDEYLLSILNADVELSSNWMDESTPKSMEYEVVDGVGVLAISGTMTRDPHCMMDVYGVMENHLALQKRET